MSKPIKRKLTFIDIFCVATGAMISSGLFILPGLAFAKAGPAVILSYALAAILCIPTALSKAELTTAMPKAGGDYFYLMRGFGPLIGTIAGISSWFSLSLKSAFALLGMGAYLSVITHLPLVLVACLCCVFFVMINLLGVKEAASVQVILVLMLLTIIVFYVFMGIKDVKIDHYSPFIKGNFNSILTTASFVFISYGGLTKISALAEEIKNPGKTIPLGLIVSLRCHMHSVYRRSFYNGRSRQSGQSGNNAHTNIRRCLSYRGKHFQSCSKLRRLFGLHINGKCRNHDRFPIPVRHEQG